MKLLINNNEAREFSDWGEAARKLTEDYGACAIDLDGNSVVTQANLAFGHMAKTTGFVVIPVEMAVALSLKDFKV